MAITSIVSTIRCQQVVMGLHYNPDCGYLNIWFSFALWGPQSALIDWNVDNPFRELIYSIKMENAFTEHRKEKQIKTTTK